MSEVIKTYRIKTNIDPNKKDSYIMIDANLVQDYDTFDILSVKINSVDTYKLHNANYGVVVGRVLANNGFGVPNAKLSIFIPYDSDDGDKIRELYPFSSTGSKNRQNVKYNLLPDEKTNDCHQVIGTFPNKRFALDNDVMLEVFDKYYKYTTRTNNAGDYLIMGVPVGSHTLHMDLDLSDCGILSQRPRDFVYKGYTIEQFENPNMFKNGTTYDSLSQVFRQDQVVNVQPFWGNTSLGETIGITRADINISFKFEPTCVFLGSIISDNSSQGISKKCIPTENMGYMEELNTGEGTIEMIRKTPNGAIEEFQVKGTNLINGDGVWCYQIPMNLDYMMTDEYGNMVPTDNPDKGIPTRARVRFRVSMNDNEENIDNFFRAKVLVPHNPQILNNGQYEKYDYEFGTYTRDDSFRDLFWNNVYSIKSYIPRIQKQKTARAWKEKKFTGIKGCNYFGSNNPFPYNNMRIKLPFMFTVMCALIKVFIFAVGIINTVISTIGRILSTIGSIKILGKYHFKNVYRRATELSMVVIQEGLCPDLENWFFAPMFRNNLWIPNDSPPPGCTKFDLLKQTLEKIKESEADSDPHSIDANNSIETDEDENAMCLTIYTDYLISCVEMNLAMEHRVINFDFYNDWVNGVIYIPRFMRYVKSKKTFFGSTVFKTKVLGCMDNTSVFSKTRRYTQQCAMGYGPKMINGKTVYVDVKNTLRGKIGNKYIKWANNVHKRRGLKQVAIFGKSGGICHEHTTLKGQYVYYMKPCEWTQNTSPNLRKVNLFATDIILLGSLNDCDLNGIPQAFKYLSSTSYIMPTNLALTNMESSGPLYVNNKGSICDSNSYLTKEDISNGAKVETISPNLGLVAELMAFSGSQSSDNNILYDGNELSDVIALTEAAGISWNYTGPGQGEINEKEFYYPGGHFLGISCVNSQTNIKTCVNLSRICEIGANISQRKEDISSVNKDGTITYTYTAPSGFISGNDIVGGDFRTMFATLNNKRLIATKTNPYTGYKMYDINFLKPINFDGAFYGVVSQNEQYNNPKIEIPEEDKTFLEKIGINIDFNKDSRPDYDENEYVNTQTRTVEDTSVDYYLFRMGLSYDDLTKTNQKHLRKFLMTKGNELFLPQYENSYYFYFGLKNGSTAIDEFNKQFFSKCDNTSLIIEEPSISIDIDGEVNVYDAKANIFITTTNIETPYQYIEIISDVEFIKDDDGRPLKKLLVKNGDEYDMDDSNSITLKYDEWLHNYSFGLPESCPFGTYKVTIMDANGLIISQTKEIGVDVLSYKATTCDFNTVNNKKSSNIGDILHKGGYIEISDFKISGLEEGYDLTLYVKELQNNEYVVKNEVKNVKNGDFETYVVPVTDVGVHELWVKYKSDTSDVYTDLFIQSFNIKDSSNLSLMLGDPNISAITMSVNTHPYGWWTKISGDDNWIEKVSIFNEVEKTNRPKNASSLKVYPIGGTKVVWGHPQNQEGVYTDKVYSSEEYVNIPAGYVVDDEYVHWPTLYFNNKELTHFSALVYDNTNVMGEYSAYLKDGVIKYNSSEDEKKFIKGYGYIFKPLPSGNLQFKVYNGEILEYDTSDEYNTEIKNGVFYPSVIYPSLDRPFYSETNFFCWSRRTLEINTNEVGEKIKSVNDYEEGGRTEMEIHNGITFNQKFSDKSFISNIYDFAEKTFTGTTDVYGLFENGFPKDRKIKISGYSDNVVSKNNCIVSADSGITSYSYEIIEGAPDENGELICNTIYDMIDSKFVDYLTCVIKPDSSGRNHIYGPLYNDTDNDDNVSYHLCKTSKSNIEPFLIESPEKYLYVKNDRKTYHVCSTYAISGTNIEFGAPLIATVKLFGGFPYFNGATCSYPLTDENGDIYTYTTNQISVSGNNIISILDTVFENCTDIKGVINYQINYKCGEWASRLKNATIRYEDKYDDLMLDNNIYFGYGVINSDKGYVNSGTPYTSLYKIYPTLAVVNDYNDGDYVVTYNNKEYYVGDEITVNTDSDYTELSVNVSCGNIIPCHINENIAWVKTSKNVIRSNGDVIVKVERNRTGINREDKVLFEFGGDDIITMNIKQGFDINDAYYIDDYTYKAIARNITTYSSSYPNLIGEMIIVESLSLKDKPGKKRIYLPTIKLSEVNIGYLEIFSMPIEVLIKNKTTKEYVGKYSYLFTEKEKVMENTYIDIVSDGNEYEIICKLFHKNDIILPSGSYSITVRLMDGEYKVQKNKNEV